MNEFRARQRCWKQKSIHWENFKELTINDECELILGVFTVYNDLPKYKLNGVDITLEQDAFLVVVNIKVCSDGFYNFLTNPDIKYGDIGDEDEEGKIRFLRDIRYDTGVGDERSKRFKTIKRLFDVRKNRGVEVLLTPTI